jgi:hypothetical protein
MKFNEFPKIARLGKECVITEKIDGTNASVHIEEDGTMWCASRTRFLWNSKDGMLRDDNYGFAAWCIKNVDELKKFGVGSHFGEWWGNGINRGYGISDKRWSLFNTAKWSDDNIRPACCSVVPILYTGIFDTNKFIETLEDLKIHGSYAVPFMNPEGIVVYYPAGKFLLKRTFDNKPKGINVCL